MLTLDKLNQKLIDAQYAVRGKIVIRAQELEEKGKKIIYCNIGNPQALKQKPLTYIREVLSLVEFPYLLNNPDTEKLFHKDSIRRAKFILEQIPEGVGAYSQSAGVPFIRKAIADFIAKRDGIPVSKDHIILTDGASKGVTAALNALLRNENDGVMIPIPQYPLYSATLTMFGGKRIDYFIDEENSWQLNEESLIQSIEDAKKIGINPVAIAVINPGNPTGAVLSYDNIKMIFQFAKKYGLSVIADEVYQENVYDPNSKFYSFAKVLNDLGESDITLFSFHSMSKGYFGECGHRGGYFEIRNIPDDVMAMIIKQQSISLCANLIGQIATFMMVNPPQQGDESYDLFVKERDHILNDMKAKAIMLYEGLNKVKGMFVQNPQGAMYAFVKFELPHPAGIEIEKLTPCEKLAYESKRDSDYSMALLEETGICVVPGSGFGQLPGTLHFRTTILPPKEDIAELIEKIKIFHEKYSANIK